MADIIFKHALGTTSIGEHVKSWTFEQLKEVYEGKLDYVSLAKQLGIKPELKTPKTEKPANNFDSENKSGKEKK